jgi:hypothetical protein
MIETLTGLLTGYRNVLVELAPVPDAFAVDVVFLVDNPEDAARCVRKVGHARRHTRNGLHCQTL